MAKYLIFYVDYRKLNELKIRDLQWLLRKNKRIDCLVDTKISSMQYTNSGSSNVNNNGKREKDSLTRSRRASSVLKNGSSFQ